MFVLTSNNVEQSGHVRKIKHSEHIIKEVPKLNVNRGYSGSVVSGESPGEVRENS